MLATRVDDNTARGNRFFNNVGIAGVNDGGIIRDGQETVFANNTIVRANDTDLSGVTGFYPAEHTGNEYGLALTAPRPLLTGEAWYGEEALRKAEVIDEQMLSVAGDTTNTGGSSRSMGKPVWLPRPPWRVGCLFSRGPTFWERAFDAAVTHTR